MWYVCIFYYIGSPKQKTLRPSLKLDYYQEHSITVFICWIFQGMFARKSIGNGGGSSIRLGNNQMTEELLVRPGRGMGGF